MKKLLVTLFVIILGAAAVFFFYKYAVVKIPGSNEIVLFYGKSCPHCEKVEQFLQKNSVDKKVKFIHKEVTTNRGNLNQLVKTMKYCGIPVKGYIEVPLLWDGSGCIRGQGAIIKFFQGKLTNV